MPLIKCADCGRELSTAAACCPQCGRPRARIRVNTLRTGGKYELLGTVLILGGLFGMFSSSGHSPTPYMTISFAAFAIGVVTFLAGRFM